MNKQLVLVTDGGRARFFRVEKVPRGPRLVEAANLENAEGRLSGSEMFANLKSGRNRAPGAGPAHGYDDHRARHTREVEQRFAKRVAERAAELVQTLATEELVVMAEPHMLGCLRGALDHGAFAGVAVHEFAEDRSWHDPRHIQDALAKHGIVLAA